MYNIQSNTEMTVSINSKIVVHLSTDFSHENGTTRFIYCLVYSVYKNKRAEISIY